MASERCGFTPQVRGDPDRGRVCCWRPVYHGGERCIWHVAEGERSVVELDERQPRAGERLDGAKLAGLTLIDVDWFADTVLLGADLTDANVDGANFSNADLRKASLDDASARGTTFTNAELEGASLSGADLRGADLGMAAVDHADLSGTRINSETTLGRRTIYDRLMDRATDVEAKTDALEAAVRSYRQYETLSHTNSLYDQASRYYRRSKDVRRRHNWEAGNHLQAMTAEVSRLITGYGNQPWRVIATAILVMVGFGAVYPFVGGLRTTGDTPVVYAIDDVAGTAPAEVVTTLVESGFFSIITFSTLGYGTLEPVTATGRYLAGIESLVGSLVLALLVAVLTRSTWLR